MKDIDSDGSDAADAFQVRQCDLLRGDLALFRPVAFVETIYKGLLATGS